MATRNTRPYHWHSVENVLEQARDPDLTEEGLYLGLARLPEPLRQRLMDHTHTHDFWSLLRALRRGPRNAK